VQITKDESGSVLKIQGTLDISIAEEFRKALCDFLGGAPSPTLDLSGVDACDTAALQLLYAARITAERSGKPLQFVGWSGAVANTAAALGLSAADEGKASAI
jgi:anti-anti-sigma factor